MLSASPAGLFLGGRLALAREVLTHAIAHHSPLGWTVVLHHQNGKTYTVHLPDEDSCTALVAALGLDPAHSSARFVIDSSIATHTPAWFAWGFALSLMVNNVLAARGIIPFSVVFALLFTWTLITLLVLALPSTVTIGLDTVVISWFGRTVRLPYSAIVSVRAEPERVCLGLTNGSTVTLGLRFSPPRFADGFDTYSSRRAWSHAIANRLDAANRLGSNTTPPPVPEALLPSGRDTDSWLSALAAMHTNPSNYRAISLSPELLWQLIESPRSPPSARVAAAATLAPSLDSDGRTRVRISADTSAEPEVRDGLSAVADESTEKLSSALRRVASKP